MKRFRPEPAALRLCRVRSALGLAAMLMLAGCAGIGGTSQPRAPNVNLSGYPPAFKEGYVDGCETARVLIGTQKDERRFKSDPQYAQGWRDGFDICKRR